MTQELSKRSLLKGLFIAFAVIVIIAYLILNPFVDKAYIQPNKRLAMICIGGVVLFELHMLIKYFIPAIKYIRSLRGIEAVLAPLGYAVAILVFPALGILLSIIIQNNITDWFGRDKPPETSYVSYSYSDTYKGTSYYIVLANGMDLRVDEDFYNEVNNGDKIQYIARCSFFGCFVEGKTIVKQ